MRINKVYILLIVCMLFASLLLKAHEKEYTIFIAQDAWHTGIVLQVQDLSDSLLPEVNHYNHFKYIDVSWGDKDFYQTPGFPVWYAAKAILFPTKAVVRVVGFYRDPFTFYSKTARLAKIKLTPEEFTLLCKQLSSAFLKSVENKAIMAENENFYLASQKYSLFRTCNTWVARALKESGLNVSVFPVILAGQLFRHLRKVENYSMLRSKD